MLHIELVNYSRIATFRVLLREDIPLMDKPRS